MHVALFSIVAGFFVAIPAMGPASAISIRRILVGHERRGLAFASGYILAEGLGCLAAIWGVDLLVYGVPGLAPVLRWTGVAVLLGVGVYFAGGFAPTTFDDREGERGRGRLGGEFALGFGMTAFNPSLFAGWTTAVGLALSATGVELATWQKWAVPVGIVVGEFLWYGVLVAVSRRYGDRLDEEALDWIVRGIGVVLAGLALWTGYQTLVGG